MKNITLKIILLLLDISLILVGINIGFWMMNQANTILFILGIAVTVLSILGPIEIAYRRWISKKIKK
jgi:uncharacterized membrane protein